MTSELGSLIHSSRIRRALSGRQFDISCCKS